MESTMSMTVGEVLNEYDDECELFEILLLSDYSRELSKQLLVLKMWLFSRRPLPSPVMESRMIPDVRLVLEPDVDANWSAGYLKAAFEKCAAALLQIRSGSPAPVTTPTAPSYLRYFYENKSETVMGMATMINTGIPALIFDDDIRRGYLNNAPGQMVRLCSPFKEIGPTIAAFDKITENQRTMKFQYDRKHGRHFSEVMVRVFERTFGAGCVEKVVFGDDVNPPYPESLTGRIVFEEPASYLQFAFSRDGQSQTKFAIDGKTFYILS